MTEALCREREKTLRRRARSVMEGTAEPGLCLTATWLAEEAADALGHLEWLDDSEHWVWDLAMEVAYAKPRGVVP